MDCAIPGIANLLGLLAMALRNRNLKQWWLRFWATYRFLCAKIKFAKPEPALGAAKQGLSLTIAPLKGLSAWALRMCNMQQKSSGISLNAI